jgi:hypothetical protein
MAKRSSAIILMLEAPQAAGLFEGGGRDTAEDGSIGDIDCGVYASPTNSSSDNDAVYADRTADGAPSTTYATTARR